MLTSAGKQAFDCAHAEVYAQRVTDRGHANGRRFYFALSVRVASLRDTMPQALRCANGSFSWGKPP
ncbi:hypothetical protein IQ259_16760 [Fortiea sp. LEGE XX443]|uniref:hypothetical protein n=1 Tax=Fortiea sp. LEGE XX443 TaxID=1828611 RepID=UPI00187E68CF|nr:hypothetical protein [Fortiea sp. LEGE XX443]MBE9006671.1 hypothetical protein [Fortiea sp. LEGE XX443]